jgi:hypothetical protein
MRNWRNNTPQRVIIFSKDQLDMRIGAPSPARYSFSYGIPFISNDYNKLGFGIIDDTLNDIKLTSMLNTQTKKASPLQTYDNNIIFRRIVPTYSTPHTIDIFDHITNDEFVIARKRINKQDDRIPMVMLVWNIGHLEVYNTEYQSYCVPSLCMAELLPHGWWYFLEQQSGWLLMEDPSDNVNKLTRQYLLYDIRRGRLAISFSTRTDTMPTIGKATPDKVQIYYSYITRISGDVIASESCQYYWHTIEISVQSDIPISTIDLTWYDQTPTNEAIETVRATHRSIMECVEDQGYWCGKGYLLKRNSASESMLIPAGMEFIVQPRHLIDDLFLLAPPKGCIVRNGFLLIHSLSQQYATWSKNGLDSYVLIPEEKAILTYASGTIQLLNMYTGNILNSFSLQGCSYIDHIIGPLCYFYDEKRMLIDVRTGEIVCILDSDSVIRFWIRSVLQLDIEPDDIMGVLGPTCIEYINTYISSALVCEYAQI